MCFMESDGSNVRHQHSHEDGSYRRVELISGRLRRRSWSSSEKAKIVAESMEPGASVTAVARRHQLSRGLLWAWRRQAVDHLVSGTETRFVPLHLVAEAEEFTTSSPDVHDKVEGTGRAGSIDIEIGGACVRVHGAVDPEALRQVLGLIGRLR
jgi:transposase